jgi:hypothetical protein
MHLVRHRRRDLEFSEELHGFLALIPPTTGRLRPDVESAPSQRTELPHQGSSHRAPRFRLPCRHQLLLRLRTAKRTSQKADIDQREIERFNQAKQMARTDARTHRRTDALERVRARTNNMGSAKQTTPPSPRHQQATALPQDEQKKNDQQRRRRCLTGLAQAVKLE